MSRGWATGIVFTALLLAAPWPWYLVAVGGLLPVPLIVAMVLGFGSNLVAATLLAICAAIGIAVFYFLARWLASRPPALRPWLVSGVVGLLVFALFQPIYGGGENLMTPAGKFASGYAVYASSLRWTR